MIFWLWKSLSLWAPLLVGVAHQNPPLTTTRPPTKFSSTKSWAAFQKIFKACSLLFGKLLQHGLSLENLVGHAVITAVNVIDVFISSRPWRCLHVYQVFSYMRLSISVLSCWKKWKRKRWIYLHMYPIKNKFFRLSCFASPTPCPPWSPWRRRATLRWSSQSIQEFNIHLQGASIDLPYSYSLLPGEPSHAFITILGIMLILPFIHLFFVLLYKLRCSLVKVRMEEKPKSNSPQIKPL